MDDDQLSRVFAALADPTRRDIVARLAVGDATVGQLADPYDVSVQAVSKHIKVLTDAGLVRRIQPPGDVARYESRVGDNHHHVVCRACGAMDDVDCAVGAMPCLTPADDHGYAIDEAEVIYHGLCPECSAARNPESTSDPEGRPRA